MTDQMIPDMIRVLNRDQVGSKIHLEQITLRTQNFHLDNHSFYLTVAGTALGTAKMSHDRIIE